MPTSPNYGWITPTLGGDPGSWDDKLNDVVNKATAPLGIDQVVKVVENKADAAQADATQALADAADTRLAFSNVVAVGTGALTSEVDLMSFTFPALATGDLVEFEIAGDVGLFVNSTRTVRLYLGTILLATITVTGSDTPGWMFHGFLVQRSSSAGRVRVLVGRDGSSPSVTMVRSDVLAPNPGGEILKVTGQTANASDEITAHAMTVKLHKAP